MRTAIDIRDLVYLEPGTVVSAQKSGGVEHFGILTEVGTIVSASKIRQAVVEETPLQFSLGAQIYVHDIRGRQRWEQTVWMARSKLGEPYRLFDRNCEHFVRFCHGLPQKSPQLAAAVGTAILAGVLLLALST